jgi:uncharacterized membrane protein
MAAFSGPQSSVMRSGDYPSSPRLASLDALRGLIMILMALDHASFFIARMHSHEFWGTALPVYPSALPFVLRLASHLCAPGFFFLMGAGMALMAAAREREGWSSSQVMRFLGVRGALLIGLQLFVENPAWGLAFVFGVPGRFISRGGPLPGGGGGLAVYFGVLFALGAAMIIWALILRWHWKRQLTLALGAILITQWATPGEVNVHRLYPEMLRLLLIPGRTDHALVLYPVIPWLGIAGLGVVFGRMLTVASHTAIPVSRTALGGVLLLLAFVVMRSGGGPGNFHPPLPGWIGYFNLTKYPPSMVFLCLTLGVNGLLLSALSLKWVERRPLFSVISCYGRTPLFFYVMHLYLYGAMGWLVPTGVAPLPMLLFWLAGLVVLYPLCRRYDRFKRQGPQASLWRYF